jgi:ribonuclease E
MLRSTASIALHVLRVVEDALIKSASHDLIVKTRTPVALYILNEKRATLRDLERRFGVAVTIDSDDSLIGAVYHAIERGEPASGGHEPLALAAGEPAHFTPEEFGEEILVEFEEPHENAPGSHLPAIEAQDEDETQDENGQRREGESESEADSRRRRRRRRRRGRGSDREGSGIAANAPQPSDEALQVMAQIGGLQPLGANAGNAFEGEATSDAEPEFGAEEGVAEAPVETAAVGETAPPLPDAEAVPAKTGERRRSRRGVKARDAAAEAAAETLAGVAPELALEGQAQDAPAANAGAETEAAPPARRSRRAPRARAPRRAAAGIEAATAPTEAADVSAAEGQPISAKGEAAPAVSHAPEALTEHHAAESVAEPVLDLQSSQGAPAAEAPASVPAHEPAEPETQPAQEQDPNRPKRSGWWQRAKASLSR